MIFINHQYDNLISLNVIHFDIITYDCFIIDFIHYAMHMEFAVRPDGAFFFIEGGRGWVDR